MRLVRLYGFLGEQFGTEHWLDVQSPAEAVHALVHTVAGFEDALISDQAYGYSVFIDDVSLGVEDFGRLVGKNEAIKIVPTMAAAKDGFDRVVMGIIILVATYYTFGATAVFANSAVASVGYGIGASMVAGGIAQMMAPVPGVTAGSIGNKSDIPSYAFSGPVNSAAQGACIPVLYGRLRVGSVVASNGLDTQAFYGQHGNPSEDGIIFGDGSDVPWSWVLKPVWS